MRGRPENNGSLWYSINVEDLIEPGHPLRAMKRMVDEALHEMSDAFSAAYATNGRPGVPPERLLKALLLQCLYSIRARALSASEDGPALSVVPRHATRAMRSLIQLSSQKIVPDSQSMDSLHDFLMVS